MKRRPGVERDRRARARGFSLVELLIALLVLSIGVLALLRTFARSAGAESGARMRAAAGMYAQQKMEELRGRDSTATELTIGRHPAGSACDTLATSKAYLRYYNVATMPSPLADLRKVTIVVRWRYNTLDSVQTVSYVR